MKKDRKPYSKRALKKGQERLSTYPKAGLVKASYPFLRPFKGFL